ncbi:hypothetical protein K488DRAFT_88134 [Vararia minispora EC-137]|uniref:Uncharacterized protein n=1 Tax=Vararia minispora EC-137 TaxID=1314806 RepID=A0ACB8QEM4_9AGAM|nr:hypothetical protein K488DRAFT_88134 [Vararia minispora EC-137]
MPRLAVQVQRRRNRDAGHPNREHRDGPMTVAFVSVLTAVLYIVTPSIIRGIIRLLRQATLFVVLSVLVLLHALVLLTLVLLRAVVGGPPSFYYLFLSGLLFRAVLFVKPNHGESGVYMSCLIKRMPSRPYTVLGTVAHWSYSVSLPSSPAFTPRVLMRYFGIV